MSSFLEDSESQNSDSSSSSEQKSNKKDKSCKKDCRLVVVAQKVGKCRQGERGKRGKQGFPGPPGQTGPVGAQGPPGETGPSSICLCDIDKIDCFDTIFSTPNDQSITFFLDYTPGGTTNPDKVPPISTYVNINVTATSVGATTLPLGVYNGWCADLYNTINVGQSYTVEALSFLDPSVLSSDPAVNPLLQFFARCAPGSLFNTQNIPAVLYVINKAAYYEEVDGFTSDDIQTAIWTLFNEIVSGRGPYTGPLPVDPRVPGFRASDVYTIVNEALAAQAANPDPRYIPLLFPRPEMALFLVPTAPNCQQIMILSVQLDQITLCCCPGLTGPVGPIGASAVPIYLSAPGVVADTNFVGLGSASGSFIANTVVLPTNLTVTTLVVNARDNILPTTITATLFKQTIGTDGSPVPQTLVASIPTGTVSNCGVASGSISLLQCDLISVQVTTSPNGTGPPLLDGISISLSATSP